jgi:predicted N-acetyltransferase YhbS
MKLHSGPPPGLHLQSLEASHPIAAFSSGDAAIDAFLATHALVEQGAGLSRTVVAVNAVSREIVGFFTLSPMSIKIEPRVLTALGMAAIAYPAVGGYLVGRLGVHSKCQGQGLGSALIAIATERARRSREETGGVFLAVDAKTERLPKRYSTFGFQQVGQSKRLVLKL